ncbi:MAG: hypothetical protein HZA09_03665 [Nitrospirae bacterium]|nr:hypothetical protein [Nitrospirota bacterium]
MYKVKNFSMEEAMRELKLVIENLVIGLAGIFLLFVIGGCEKEKSVTGPTAFNASETSINDAAMVSNKSSSEANTTTKDFWPDKNYQGDMFISINPGYWGCKDLRERNGYATARIIWGPWQTEDVQLHSTKSVAIKFKKINKDSVQLTVIVKGCDMPTIYLNKGKPPKGYYLEYTPNWILRTR